jgi:hypothetical protein
LVQRVFLDADAGIGDEEVGTLQLATGDLTDGPDWPEVAVIAPNTVAASWIEYGASEDTLHVGRYRVCYGD